VSSKFAGIVGPFLFGIVGQLTGTSRISIVAIVLFFFIGGLVLTTVDHSQGIKDALREEEKERLRTG
jgi:UMF1 family MFS transporter